LSPGQIADEYRESGIVLLDYRKRDIGP